MSIRAFTFGRDVSVAVTGAFPIDGYRAFLEKIQYFENLHESDPDLEISPVPDDMFSICTSKTTFRIYKFQFFIIRLQTGNYFAEFVESADNVESLTT